MTVFEWHARWRDERRKERALYLEYGFNPDATHEGVRRTTEVAPRVSKERLRLHGMHSWRNTGVSLMGIVHLRPANVRRFTCAAGAHVPKPTRRGRCRGARAQTRTASCNGRDAVILVS